MNACLGDSSVSTNVHLGTADVCDRRAGVQTGKDTKLLLCLVSLILQGRKHQASSCETLGLRVGGKPWAGGGQPGLAAS